jgi:hypothetical protein
MHCGASCELDRATTAEDLDRSWQEDVGPASKVEIGDRPWIEVEGVQEGRADVATITGEAL